MKKIIINAVVVEGKEEKKVSIIIKKDIIEDIIYDNNIKINYDDFEEVIDANNNYVLPGLVDLNCELTEPGYEFKEDIATLSEAGAKGGYTTINCIPRTSPAVDNKIIVRYILDRIKNISEINMLLTGNITRDDKEECMSEMYEMKREGISALSDCNVAVQSTLLLSKVFKYSSIVKMPIILLPVDTELRDDGIVHDGRYSSETGLKGIPKTAEELAVAKYVILARQSGVTLHLTKISTDYSLSFLKFARQSNMNLTVDTCPQYFTLTDEYIETYSTKYKIYPPLRTEDDRKATIKAIQDGTINVITSGHSPDSISEKKSDFVMASDGISSIETAFYISYNTLVKEGLISISDLIEKMSTKPCEILNIKNKGAIKKGYYADLFIFDNSYKNKIDIKKFASKAKFSPYDGYEHEGLIKCTICNGKVVYRADVK